MRAGARILVATFNSDSSRYRNVRTSTYLLLDELNDLVTVLLFKFHRNAGRPIALVPDFQGISRSRPCDFLN